MSATPRLLQVATALTEAGLKFLIMGGHAVRYYGVERNTADFDFHLSTHVQGDLTERLQRCALFSRNALQEGTSWRRGDFRRFQIGVLPNGKEEWLEFWFRNHLLPIFDDAYIRREEATAGPQILCYLSLRDPIRSEETERDDDWADVRLLEEILDERNLSRAKTQNEVAKAADREDKERHRRQST